MKLLQKLKRWRCKHPSLEQRYRTTYHTEEQKGITLPMLNSIKYCLVCGKDLHITTAFDWGAMEIEKTIKPILLVTILLLSGCTPSRFEIGNGISAEVIKIEQSKGPKSVYHPERFV